jgi:glycosyltransferase involved in cell wall biosynthesis
VRISYYTVDGNLDVTNGYGRAGFGFIQALQKLGHEVPFDDGTTPIQISFCQPTHYKFRENQYKIGYTPWESTELPHGWLEKMNACDEIWATSKWVADVYHNAGVTVPIYVVHHGLDPKWTPVKRECSGVTNFFHHGEPALRKGGQLTLDAFRQVFGDREDVHLTFKANSQHYLRTWKDGAFSLPDYNNVTIITTLMHESELVELYKKMDVMVYPSYGEGFGLIPLQALGTGMPVISTVDWAPYAKYVNLKVPANLDRSVWPVHPGNMYFPEFDELKWKMELAHDNILTLQEDSYGDAPSVHADFSWEKIAQNVTIHLEKIA